MKDTGFHIARRTTAEGGVEGKIGRQSAAAGSACAHQRQRKYGNRWRSRWQGRRQCGWRSCWQRRRQCGWRSRWQRRRQTVRRQCARQPQRQCGWRGERGVAAWIGADDKGQQPGDSEIHEEIQQKRKYLRLLLPQHATLPRERNPGADCAPGKKHTVRLLSCANQR